MIKTLFTSALIITTVLVVDYFKVQSYCDSYSCRQSVDGVLASVLILSVLVFFFSLVACKTPKRVGQQWWSFAKYVIPVVFVLSVLINSGVHHNPAGQWQDILDIPILLTLYGLFVIGSLVQIWRGYRKE